MDIKKVCSKCKESKSLDFFSLHRNGYRRSDCKPCRVAYSKKYRINNLEKVKKYQSIYHKEHQCESNKKRKEQRDNDLGKRIKNRLRVRLHYLLTSTRKTKTALNLVGCSLEELREHFEKKFRLGMSWENYGKWQIDHIRPCASFALDDPRQQAECFHFSNLQPLWVEENLSKGAKEILYES